MYIAEFHEWMKTVQLLIDKPPAADHEQNWRRVADRVLGLYWSPINAADSRWNRCRKVVMGKSIRIESYWFAKPNRIDSNRWIDATVQSPVGYTDYRSILILILILATSPSATGTHMPYRITQCYLPLDRADIPPLPQPRLVLGFTKSNRCIKFFLANT